MNDLHNPQNRTPEEFGGDEGWRLLTHEEAAILTDRLSAKTALGRAVLTRLAPQFWSQSACRWVAVDIGETNPTLSEVLTYRTQSPPLPPTIPVECPNPTDLDAACGDFVESWRFLAAFHHSIMIEKGFWQGEETLDQFLRDNGRDDLAEIAKAAFDGQKIALQGSELAEALEGIRHGNGPDDKVPQFNAAEAEFADVMLRLMDHAHKRGWDIAAALVAKMKMNATRAAMHGGKRF